MSRNSWANETDSWRRDDPNAPHNRMRSPRAKKDTKQWCRGKAGVQHGHRDRAAVLERAAG
jgi:hypothetical protein